MLGLLIGVVLAVELAFGFFVYNTYYESAKSAVYQKSIQSGNYSELISASDADYGIRALNFVENFQYKEEIEVHVLDKSGKVIVTSSGFTPTEQEMPDYSAAQSAENRRGEWMGRNSAGINSPWLVKRILGWSSLSQDGRCPSVTRWMVRIQGAYAFKARRE